MKRHWIWAALVPAVAIAAFYSFIRTAEVATNNPPFVTTTALWLALIPAIFILVLFLAGSLAVLTWRATAEGKKSWKVFWNVVEVVWLLGTGLSIFGVITTQAASLIPLARNAYARDIRVHGEVVTSLAKHIRQEFCIPAPADPEICARVDDLIDSAKLTDPNMSALRGDFAWKFLTSVNQFRRQHPESPALTEFERLSGYLWDYSEDLGFFFREATTLVIPGWAKWLTILSPQIFAFVFPLRLGRALAAFAL